MTAGPIHMRNTILTLAAAGLSLAACTSPNCDPNQAGFLSGLGNAGANCYAARTSAYQNQLNIAKGQERYEADRANIAAARALDAQGRVAGYQALLGGYDTDIREMDRSLTRARATRSASDAALQDAQRSLDELRRARQNAATGTPQAVEEADRRAAEARQRRRDLLGGS